MEAFEAGERVGDFIVQYSVGNFRYVVYCGCGYLWVRRGEELCKASGIICTDCQKRQDLG